MVVSAVVEASIAGIYHNGTVDDAHGGGNHAFGRSDFFAFLMASCFERSIFHHVLDVCAESKNGTYALNKKVCTIHLFHR